ncbi:breast cancer protein [Truncatella angustata]|uniref:Inclusion body clearance protein IML2 n=1 Tax=Truncatella angustata TaxID=152316 RepID=A0A9P8UD09_9PEZI|nr:breast cancer protein [Truncatella angustata]KAH6646567.1 breast cancer protein [Truncatella angustata]
MSRIGGWLRGSSAKTSAKASLNASPAGSMTDLRAAEIALMQDAMTSAAKIMNDDIEGAEEDLRKGSSAFHALGLGITTFMRSVLGFEKEIMAEASKKLSECETLSWNEQKKAEKAGVGDKIYPAGSEYALVYAEAQLMSAMVAVLHESYLEAAKGFWGLRGAYATLDRMMQAEEAFLKKRGLQLGGSKDKLPPARTLEQEGIKPAAVDDEDADLEFVEAPDHQSGTATPLQYEGHLSSGADDAEKKLAGLAIDEKSNVAEAKEQQDLSASQVLPLEGPEAEIFTDPVDEFVHSGANMCFGILLLMISMIPPSFAKLLSIIGFRGDRERGVRMLWQSSRFNNINGAVAGLVLLAYYNGLLGFADILPSEDEAEKGAIVGYPKQRCRDLLARMVKSYPESRLWRMEEARGLSNSRNLPGAIELLLKNTDSKMRQVTALNNFELSLDTMYVGQFEAMRDNFIRCTELNDWSHSLYFFLAGCAELELYRNAFHAEPKDEVQIRLHKTKAEELFLKAPTLAGKKKLMSRPLPFEEFVRRKVQKWDKRSVDMKISLVDAVGTSPLQEMVYLWNGIKKMQPVELERAVGMLSWTRLTAPEEAAKKIKAENDEIAVSDVCLAAAYRALGRLDDATDLLKTVLAIDKSAFDGKIHDDWAQPAAAYEMGVLAWVEVEQPGLRRPTTSSRNANKTDIDVWRRKKTDECQNWLDKCAAWGSYILDARIGMRVQTGMDTLRWYKRTMGWSSV